ncbi:MAG: rhodanese-like domain-containing protein [Actinomycetota bacterium]
MLTKPALQSLEFEEALDAVDRGAAFIDLRPIASYFEVHIPGSIPLLYEFGPGLASRARDCLPLSLSLVVLDLGHGDCAHAAASLRGKGFTVLGKIEDGINQWAALRGTPRSTEIVASPVGKVVDVGDPGAQAGDDAIHIPIERLWGRVDELRDHDQLTVASGYGVRASVAAGILERAGHDVAIWSTRH